MCVIIAKPAEKILDKEQILQKCYEHNQDGWGFSAKADGVLTLWTGTTGFEDFWKSYEPYQNQKCLIHFRIATLGSKTLENCHPFKVKDGLVLAHNGTFSLKPTIKEKYPDFSDTRIFNEELLKPLFAEVDPRNTKIIKMLLESYIESNKIVLFDGEEFSIFNESLGGWKDGVWFSNFRWNKKEWDDEDWYHKYNRKRYHAKQPNRNYYSTSVDDQVWNGTGFNAVSAANWSSIRFQTLGDWYGEKEPDVIVM